MTFTVDKQSMDDGAPIAVYRWPAPSTTPKAVVQIAHGLAEHAGRYDRAAQALSAAGYQVIASDHRGHGRSAVHPADFGYFAAKNGFRRVVEDLYAINTQISREHPGLKRVLFGHSFGSFATQAYLFTHGDSLAAAVLSGTESGVAAAATAGLAIAQLERLRMGGRNRSRVLQALSFGNYNRRFEPVRTPFDWLSRDEVEVDKYIADPWCGFDVTVQGWIDVFRGLIWINDPNHQAKVPKQLPAYLIAGEEDPVGRAGKGPRALARAYERAGLTCVTCKLYPGARHELLNETNRDEVTSDLIAWLDANVASA